MKKLAIFVEGQTEQILIERLVLEIAHKDSLDVELQKTAGARSSGNYRITVLKRPSRDSGRKYFIQIIDCGSDNRVGSEIRDNYETLSNAGFESIIGIRDVYPSTDIPALRKMLHYKLKTAPIRVFFFLGVLEIETWFLAEYTHYQKIHPALDPDRVASVFGFDPRTDDLQLRPQPSADLNAIYHLEGLAYRKSRKQIQRTVNVLSYERLYLEMQHIPDLDALNKHLTTFLS